jgi:hypothetical protein
MDKPTHSGSLRQQPPSTTFTFFNSISIIVIIINSITPSSTIMVG